MREQLNRITELLAKLKKVSFKIIVIIYEKCCDNGIKICGNRDGHTFLAV